MPDEATAAEGITREAPRTGLRGRARLGGSGAPAGRPPPGRNSPEIRALALRGLGWLSVELDERANAEVREDDRINAADSAIAALVLRAREDIEIATQVRRPLAGSGG